MVATNESIEDLAASWLTAEREAVARGNAGGMEDRARIASAAYDGAVRGATGEEMLVAWRAATKIQASTEMGSQAWVEARAVSELLRMEYRAGTDPTE
jgi:hypothetical protein